MFRQTPRVASVSFVLAGAVLSALVLVFAPNARAQSCQAQSPAKPLAVVELYTSEGCSSCPPADKWLSGLKGKDGVLALAFHVNYWDKLGWPDRFATPQITQRQHQLQRGSGAAYVYTPQVIVNGNDTPAWGNASVKPAAPTSVQIALVREGSTVKATVAGGAALTQLAGYWAILEDGHSTRVRAGENAGSTLLHDNVVAHYQPVAAWSAGAAAHPLAFEIPAAVANTTRPRRVVLVVTDGQGAKPLQATVLSC
jgi:hypothetical protein